MRWKMGPAPGSPHGAAGDGLGAVLTGFDVTVTGRCSTSCLAQLRRDAAVPEQLLALRRLRRGAGRVPRGPAEPSEVDDASQAGPRRRLA